MEISLRRQPVLGVDPGTRGGVAVLASDGYVAYLRGFTPEMERGELAAIIREAASCLRAMDGSVAFLEKVGYRPTDGGQGAFTFGRVYGLAEGLLLGSGLTIKDVYPAMWQSRLDCMSGGDKRVTKARAASLFPKIAMTHAIADALLIAEYGRRVLNP